MEISEFKKIRTTLNKTQKGMSSILGISIKAIHSYEQGWRKIPHHVERQMLFLLSRMFLDNDERREKCWDILKCPEDRLEKCPAREFKAGDMCWFINGTRCSGKVQSSWEEKMEACRSCRVFKKFFEM